MTQPGSEREVTQSGTYVFTPQNVGGLNVLRSNFDSAAFTNWLGAKGYRIQDLSPASLEAAVTEFRLKQINDRLDAIEAKTR